MNVFKGWRPIWQKKQAKPLDSTETVKESSTSPDQAIPLKPLLLSTCKQVSLAVFIECYCDDNYSGLGEGTPEELVEAWTDVVSEWATLMKNDDSENYLSVGYEILNLKRHITYVEQAVFFLKRRYDQEILDKLIALGYPGEYPERDTPAFHQQLDRVMSLYKTAIFRLSELNDEMARLEKSKEGGKSTEEDFRRNITRLGKYQGHWIDINKMSVFEYAMIHNNFFDDIKNNNQNKPPD